MLKLYRTNNDGITNEVNDFKKGTWINLYNPSDEEIKLVSTSLEINEEFIRYALDSEENVRIDIDDDNNEVLFIIDTPVIEENEKSRIYTTLPMGVIFVRDDYIITVSIKENAIFEDIIKGIKRIATYKKSRILLQILYNNAKSFLDTLLKVNKESEIAEHILQKTTSNDGVVHMLNLEKSLVYLTRSLKSNEMLMEKIMRGKVIKLYEEDEDLLEDAIIENKQAIEMSQIYSNILATTMEAYSSIISNNLNGVMKVLTSITIIIAIPTLIASFWGMNVPVPFSGNHFGLLIMVIISLLLTIGATIWLKKKNMLS